MLVSKYVEVKWNTRNKKYYIDKNYEFTKFGETFLVKVEDLSKGSHSKVHVKCDFCNEDLKLSYKDFLKQRSKTPDNVDACINCGHKKAELNNIRKYGVKNVMQLDSTKETLRRSVLEKYGVEHYIQTEDRKYKSTQTCLDRYGVIHYFKTDEFKSKLKQTMREKYGVDYYLQSEDYKIKSRKTNLKKYGFYSPMQNESVKSKGRNTTLIKYGVENPFQSELIKDKIKSTNLQKYGVEHISQTEQKRLEMKQRWEEWKENGRIEEIISKRSKTNIERYGFPVAMQNPEISNKAFNTMYKNNTAPSSRQQIHINNLVKGELNFPIGRCILDIAFLEDKIYLEYDGGGHDLSVLMGATTRDQFEEKEKRRTYFMLDNGWKEIRIITRTDRLPNDELIIDFVNKAKSFLLLKKYVSVKWNLETNKVLVNFKREYDLDYFLNNYSMEAL